MEVGDGVEELDPLAGLLERGDRLGQRDRVQALVVHGHVDDLALVGPEDPERADVAGRLDQHDVARDRRTAG